MLTNKISWQIIIWGAGEMTRRVMPHIGAEHVLAIIDTDEKKVGGSYLGKPIINLEIYQERYSGLFILITPMYWREIECKLLDVGVHNYFLLADCPSEFSEIKARDILRDCILRELPVLNSFAIYGSTLYALVLNEWIRDYAGTYVPIILPDSVDEKFKMAWRHGFDGINILDEAEFDKESIETVLVTDEWNMDRLEQFVHNKYIINVFDITDRELQYHSQRMEKFKDIHLGESCFIIGLGPSLRSQDLDMLERFGIITFSVNAITEVFDMTAWRPNYYVMSDPRGSSDEFLAQLEKIPKEYAFIADKVEAIRNKARVSKTVNFHALCNVPSRTPARFSTDVARYVGYGATVVYDCLQIAVYMGFKNVYLLGVDGYDPSSPSHDYGHFYEEDKLTACVYSDQVLLGYKAARDYGRAHNVNIYNATRGGYIEIFDRVSFDSLFRNKKIRDE